jgi:hypothetical protein
MRKTMMVARPQTTLPDEPPLSGLWGTIWLVTALAAVLNAAVHWDVVRLLAYGCVEVAVGLAFVAEVALWKRLDPRAAFHLLCRNTGVFLRCCWRTITERHGVRENLRLALAATPMLVVLVWVILDG